jgi:methanogenic corrinoid protein MtbC1
MNGVNLSDAQAARLAASPEDVQQFIRTLLSPDEGAPLAHALELIAGGVSPDVLYEGLFTEAARTLGEMWSSDDCSFYDVTVGTGRIHRLVRELSHQFLGEVRFSGAAGRLLLSCAADEQHSLGMALLAEFFVRDGWDVHVGPGLGSEALLDRVKEAEYDLIGFSVSVSSRLSRLQQDIRRARQVSRNRDIRVIVGGALITADPSLAERVGADGFAVDARSAVQEARRLLSA